MKTSKSHKIALILVAAAVALATQTRTRFTPANASPQEFRAAEYQNSFSSAAENTPQRKRLPVEADELHYVGYYEGLQDADSPKVEMSRPAGTAQVKVSRPGRSVALVLTAYEPIVWNIECDDTTTISHIILSGYHDQRVQANSSLLSAKVVASSYDTPGLFKYFHFHQPDQAELGETVHSLTGMKPNSIHCGYKVNEPILIDTVLTDGRP